MDGPEINDDWIKKIQDWYKGNGVDCQTPVNDIKDLKPEEKLTDMSAKAKAIALADYACKYFKAVDTNARANMMVALIQQAASAYFADKQHDTAKQAQNRFDDIWKDARDKSNKTFSHWYDNSRPIETDMLKEARAREQKGYSVDYETAINRSIATARSEFSRAIDKVKREAKQHCVGATRVAIRQLKAAEARAVVLATNSAIRYEEERKHQRESQYREEVYKWNGLFRGSVADSLNSIKLAQQAAGAASMIDPFAGWSASVGMLSNIGQAYNNMNTTGFGVANSGTGTAIATGYL